MKGDTADFLADLDVSSAARELEVIQRAPYIDIHIHTGQLNKI